ncbi:MAG: flagellar biosynthesis protein FlhA [Candidatus Rokubacteria bacterium]|nr:flagellar biosynthesis protein FlhA [Candidatus Rokubacteria bacterium]
MRTAGAAPRTGGGPASLRAERGYPAGLAGGPAIVFTDLGLAGAVLGILGMMVIPLPTVVLDILLSANLSVALLTLLVAMYILKPVEFSAFPSLLLVLTLLRLALNVASTRLILLHGHEGPAAAGEVIRAFGQFVLAGNYVVGLVVFLILVVIQFVVITKGAGRIAEVAARFTLDAMPGKQMSIDADLNAGLITEADARRRREGIAREADFYGAMDGASKFVRGDAVASLIITAINILGGLAVGVLQQGVGLVDALQAYTILTVGDGLVTQIPALIVSTAAGIVVTRAAAESDLSSDLVSQLTLRPRALGVTAGVLGSLALVPGLPTLPFLLLAGLLAAANYALRGRGPQPTQAHAGSAGPASGTRDKPEGLPPVDLLSLEVGYNLIPLVDPAQGGELLERVKALRQQFALDLGFTVPPVRVRDNLQLRPNSYLIRLKELEVAQGEVTPDRLLAINPGTATRQLDGIETREPTFGVPALWISPALKDEARAAGYTVVDPGTVVATHLSETVRRHAATLLTRQAVQEMLDQVKASQPAVLDGLIPALLPLGAVHKVLQLLLAEEVSIRDLPTILEALSDYAPHTKDPAYLAERVRAVIPAAVIHPYLGPNKTLRPLVLNPGVERLLRAGLQRGEGAGALVLEPHALQGLVNGVARALEQAAPGEARPCLLCAQDLRPHLRRLLERSFPHLGVLSYAELPATVTLQPSLPVEVEHAA